MVDIHLSNNGYWLRESCREQLTIRRREGVTQTLRGRQSVQQRGTSPAVGFWCALHDSGRGDAFAVRAVDIVLEVSQLWGAWCEL